MDALKVIASMLEKCRFNRRNVSDWGTYMSDLRGLIGTLRESAAEVEVYVNHLEKTHSSVRARDMIGDWEVDLVGPWLRDMEALALTIEKDNYLENTAEVVSSIRHAVSLYESIKLTKTDDEAQLAWQEFWLYMTDNIRNWWS